MNITRENIGPLNDVLKVTVEAGDYAATLEKKLKDYQKQAVIPGFRPGKVPASVIKKRVGKDLAAEIVTNVMAEALDKYMQENNIRYFGQPIPYQADKYSYDWENQTEFTFAYELGLTPEVAVDITKLPTFTYHTIEVAEADVDEYVQNLQERLTKETKVEEAATATDVVFGELKELAEDGLFTGETFYMAEANDFVRQALLGKQAGDVVTFQLADLFADTGKIADTFKVAEERAIQATGPFEFTIKEVRRPAAPELDQEFFDRALGPGRATTVEEFRAELRKMMENEYKRESDYKFDYDVRNHLRSSIEVPLPEEFLRRWIPTISEKPLEGEDLEKELVNLKRYLRWNVIESRILTDNNMLVTFEDLQNEAEEAVKNMFRMYGLPDRDDDTFYKEQAKRLLESEEQRQRYLDQAKNKKLFGFFQSTLKTTNKNVSKDEFKALIEEETKEAELLDM